MPNIPEMGVLWGPAESFLVAVNKSGEDVATAAETAQQAALQAIADMQDVYKRQLHGLFAESAAGYVLSHSGLFV